MKSVIVGKPIEINLNIHVQLKIISLKHVEIRVNVYILKCKAGQFFDKLLTAYYLHVEIT